MVAVDADVYCGYMCVPFDTLARVMLTAYYLTKLEANGTWTRRFKRSKGFGPLRAIWYDREQYRNGFRFDFLHVLWRARKYLEASKAEDMVYGFLAFDDSPSAHRIKADYTIHYRHTFRNLACSLIKGRESLEILQCIVSTDAIKTIEDSKNPPPRLPSWVPEWINRRFSGGAPILCPGMKHSFAASRGMKHVWVDSQDPDVLIVQGHVIDVVYKLIEIDFQESTYTHSSLRQILKVEQLASLLTRTLVETARDLDSMNVGSSTTTSRHKDPKSHPRRTYSDIREVALRTLLADGSFGPWQPIHHDIASLLRVYSEDGHKLFSAKDADDPDVALHRYIKDAGTIAEGKRVFLTQHLDIGLGYSSIHKGDLVVLLYGSLAPCILRRKKHKPGSNNEVHYKFVGHAYLDGWMYGDNLRKYKWWEREPKKFSLI